MCLPGLVGEDAYDHQISDAADAGFRFRYTGAQRDNLVFNARFRDELLNGEVFYSLKEAQIIIEEWRKRYNTKRPHSALGYRPPAPKAIVPVYQKPTMH